MVKEEIIEMLVTGENSQSRNRGMTPRGLAISLGVSAALAVTQILVFSALRKRYRAVYEPRTFIVPQHMRVSPTATGIFSWIPNTLSTPMKSIPQKVGLDAYFFLRYIVFVIIINGCLGILLVPILLPLHFTGNSVGSMANPHYGLDRLSIANISWDNRERHIAHLVLCTVCAGFTLEAFRRELQTYYRIRAEHLVKDFAPHSSSTLLIKGLHPEYRTFESIFQFYAGVSGGIKRVWFNRDYSELHKLVREQQRLLNLVEREEFWLIDRCNAEQANIVDSPLIGKDSDITGNLWRRYLVDNRDFDGMHARKGSLITWLKTQLSVANSRVYLLQSQSDLFPKVNSCFVQFDSSISCFMASRAIGVSTSGRNHTAPGAQCIDQVYAPDIVWGNLSMPTWLEATVRAFAGFLDFVVILGWAFPVAIVSMVTQVEHMVQLLPQLGWLLQMPKLSQLMSSVVSPLALSYLTSQVPLIFRALARLKGYPTRTLVEMDVQKYLFLFMFFQLFLIVTFATGLPSLLVRMMLNTSEGAISLASSLPKATNFFISYLIASSLTTAGNSLMQSAHLCRRAWDYRFATTPRQKLHAMCRFPILNWGSLYAAVTNVGAISLAYALVSPLILFAAVIGASILFLAFKYRILYCYVPRCIADGHYYPCALFQLFSGLYCQELSLLGTLLLSQQHFPALLAATLIGVTMVGHYRLNKSFQDMSTRIPIDVATGVTSSETTTPSAKEAPMPATVDVASLTSTDQWMALFDNLDTDFARLSREHQEYIAARLFEHPDIRIPRPCVWLPRDARGVAADQVREMQRHFSDLRASCYGAELGPKGRVLIKQAPPDFDTCNLMRL